eukprot:c20599_g1_i3.p1 GENE.c20599_g1_i3~~c20599_g1_i3.p1  ORF type:complete len:215 (+),score=38.24 c20599_g1_i3:221-865(+)
MVEGGMRRGTIATAMGRAGAAAGRGPNRRETKPSQGKYVGSSLMERRGVLRLSPAMVHGQVQNWDDMTQLWTHMYRTELKKNAEEHPLLFSESVVMSMQDRENIAEIFFEKLHVPAINFASQGTLALYASDRTTGVVLDSGHDLTQCVPIYEGFPIQAAMQCHDLGGHDVTDQLQLLLRKQGYPFHTSAEAQVNTLRIRFSFFLSLFFRSPDCP